MSFLAEFGRVNHRMHNKLFVMDNAVELSADATSQMSILACRRIITMGISML